MPLTQIQQVVSTPGPLAAELIESYWEAVERRIASQRQRAAHLRIQLTGEEGSYAMFDIHQREVLEQLVLTEQRHVHVAELSEWLRRQWIAWTKPRRHTGVWPGRGSSSTTER
ncbi:MAG: hypothetical protein M3228_08570 [Actinomycetota bacterium]|nr:hypothetical protein [Actinomycetota bacterium]